ncbi:copper resistance protein CopC [Corynebacterium jeddahense]|uniref:Copper transport protein YcnJ n=1 Tax=Corynebacterium jeddahense TaxID=1414719 RepID=A0ABY7UMY6_9CORY|nr:copper resistance CopC family protein [Corynebacterium jeddahense]WCZ39044.1 Copper transport protein YcnJ precursor [Corynebacterium jeddahense]
MHMPALARRGGAAAAVVAVVALMPAPAFAHDSVIGSNPKDGSVVSEFPRAIELEFSGEIQDGFNTVALSREVDGQSEVLYSGEPTVQGRDVTLDLPDDLHPEPGEYKVGFQIVSSDGHSTKGMTTFEYASGDTSGEGAEGTSTSERASDGETKVREEGMSTWAKVLLSLAGVLVVLGALVAALVKYRRVKRLDTTGSADL